MAIALSPNARARARGSAAAVTAAAMVAAAACSGAAEAGGAAPAPGAARPSDEAVRAAGGVIERVPGGVSVGFQHRGRDLGDDGLSLLEGRSDIVALNLRDTQITSDGLRHLAGLRNLRRLHLERTAVGDAGMHHLAGLGRLEYLNLYGTAVTDAGLDQLRPLRRLRQLYVWQTGATETGCARLAAAVPGLEISRGVDLDEVMAEAERAAAAPVKRVALQWVPAGLDAPPRSKTGTFTSVVVTNARDHPVKLYWVEYGGGLRFYHDIEPGASLERNTYSDAVWVVTDPDGRSLGHFMVPLEPSKITVPAR